jgi:SNF2 family DNA or RNA helicase
VDLHAYSWWIMSYGIFKNDLQYLLSMLKGRTYTTLVDEAQGLKNTSSKLFKNVEMFSAGRHLALLTGTELNNPGDAYAYIRLKTPSIYRSRAHFDNMHVEERDFFDKPVRWMGLDVLNRNLYLSSVQRTKEEVHKHLPQPNYQIIEYDLDPAHKRMYDELAEQLILETEAGGKIDGTTPGKLRNALQQLVINWPLFAENPTLRPSFLDLLDTVMDEIDVQQVTSSKLIVWTWFKNTTRYITDYLNEIGVPAVAAYSEANSRKSVDLFMDNPEIRALVAQPGSAGAGLNPQHICWECVFAEVPTRSIPFRQSAGRIDREGQRFRPNIRIATAAGTVQGQMYRDLLRNDGMVQQVQGNAFDLRALVYSSATT